MVNSLTAEAGFITGPVVLGTLVKHYLERLKRDASKKPSTQLRRDELLYDEAFNVIKKFLEISSYHTVEEVQAFGNTATPSPPWVHVVKVVVPMSCCDEAAKYLTQVLGGEESARQLVGGVKWWQVRGIDGVDGEWITARKDWEEAKRRHKAQPNPTEEPPSEPATYDADMDNMRCILYFHGGGYYFGSVDQERYSIQRHARKINGRVFTVNYRLAPQYPFPCALQDVLASYLYLIRPPPGAQHRPVNPAHIIISGDSAGGGISFALLQVIRDLGLPMPAGGVLISPWCDLTHSFPSVHTNTDTDVIPKYGLSLQKPSILWPPPSQEMTRRVHASLRSRIRKTLKMDFDPTATIHSHRGLPNVDSASPSSMPVDVGATTPLPNANSPDHDQTIRMTTVSGEELSINQQLHMYTLNSLLNHPLVSPCMSYLGGLPPLFIIASDKEVLRDEIIYTAHRAAHPERFPVAEHTRKIYPALRGIELKHKATSVHLQVYDDTAHIIPVLFSFTTPGKYCFRAIASFIKHVTGMTHTPQSPITTSFTIPSPSNSPHRSATTSSYGFGSSKRPATFASTPPEMTEDEVTLSPTSNGTVAVNTLANVGLSESSSEAPSTRKSLRRSISESIKRRATTSRPKIEGMHTNQTAPPLPDAPHAPRQESTDVAGPRFPRHDSPTPLSPEEKMAGDATVYLEASESGSWDGAMIRERVSTKGVIRPLEPESELDAMKVPEEFIGIMSELMIRRFNEGLSKFERKFAHAIKSVDKHRRNNLELANKDIIRNMTILQETLEKDDGRREESGLIPSTGSWSWAWALDGNENPPPSSIASRRDTEEARRLAKIADLGIFEEQHTLTGNNLWSVMVNFLTVSPDKEKEKRDTTPSSPPTPEHRKSVFFKFKMPSPEKQSICHRQQTVEA